jgi:Zn finger protein HypA/HybF involved in hydrogenase expression
MDIRDAKPVGTKCARCHGQANVLVEEWTPDGQAEETRWTCPRCQEANAITVAGKIVGVAIATGRVVRGDRVETDK